MPGDSETTATPEGGVSQESVQVEIRQALAANTGRLGEVYRMYVAGVTSPTKIAEAGAAANSGAAGNDIQTIRAALGGVIPASPSVARRSMSSISALVGNSDLSGEARDYLEDIVRSLRSRVGTSASRAEEVREISAAAEALEATLRSSSGVYVYTFPHYFKHPWREGSDHILLKVGATTKNAWQRVREQVRQTAAPEEPLLLRVYLTNTPIDDERKFHELLDGADHERSGIKVGGVEWFSTTLEFLDVIASVLSLQVVAADSTLA